MFIATGVHARRKEQHGSQRVTADQGPVISLSASWVLLPFGCTGRVFGRSSRSAELHIRVKRTLRCDQQLLFSRLLVPVELVYRNWRVPSKLV
jgi:hypothetical protein